MICIKEAEFNSSAHDIAHDFYGIYFHTIINVLKFVKYFVVVVFSNQYYYFFAEINNMVTF